MPRLSPRATYFSAAFLALSATLTACGGGANDAGNADTQASGSNQSAQQSGATSATASASSAGVNAATVKAVVPAPPSGATDTTATTSAPDATASSASTVVAVAGATSTATSANASNAQKSGAGLNLSAVSYYSTVIPTFDVMKRAGGWLTQCSTSATCANFTNGAGTWDTSESGLIPLDASGYPLRLPAADDTTVKYRKVSTMISANGALPAGRYIVAYDGSGTLGYGGNVSRQASLSKTGRDVVDLAAGSTASFWLTILATDPNDHLRNIRIYMPGGACTNDLDTFAADATSCTATKGAFVPFESFPQTKMWNPQFLADVKGFRTLRFMDWMNTNSTQITSWSKRPQPGDRTWTTGNGVPAEYIFNLANTVQSDPWVNMPTHADDDFILQFSRLATQTVASSLKINLEYSNEAWNYAFAATKWMLAQGQAAWPDEVAKGTNIYVLENNWYARRLVQTCAIAKGSSSDAASRFRCVSNTQAAQPSQTEQVLSCVVAAKTLGQNCAKSLDVVAVAPYFGGYVSDSSLRPTVAAWYASADGGLANLFQELTGHDATGVTVASPLSALAAKQPKGAINESNGWMTGTSAMAAKYGLPMWAYEGGQHLVPLGGDSDAAFVNLTIAANRDARMQGAYEQMIANWVAAGGQTFAYYAHVGVPAKTGSWGLKENMLDNTNAKWKAVLEKRDSACWWSGC